MRKTILCLMIGVISSFLLFACKSNPDEPKYTFVAKVEWKPVFDVDTLTLIISSEDVKGGMILYEDMLGASKRVGFNIPDGENSDTIKVLAYGTTAASVIFKDKGSFDYYFAPGETVCVNVSMDKEPGLLKLETVGSVYDKLNQADIWDFINMLAIDNGTVPLNGNEDDYTDFLIESYNAKMDSIASHDDWSIDQKALAELKLKARTLNRVAKPADFIQFAASIRNEKLNKKPIQKLSDKNVKRIMSLFNVGDPALTIINGGQYYADIIDWESYDSSITLPNDLLILRGIRGTLPLTNADIEKIKSRNNPFLTKAAQTFQNF